MNAAELLLEEAIVTQRAGGREVKVDQFEGYEAQPERHGPEFERHGL
jgi:hypothetical protein